MARPQKPLKQKILDNTTPDPKTGCWDWTSGKMLNRFGRPRILHDRKWIMASRAAYIAWVGPIPDDKYACHTCDNGMCCNPEHLFVGSPKENTQDCIRKGRWRQNAFKSEAVCSRGHELTEANLTKWVDIHGYAHRRCRLCYNFANRLRIARNSKKKPPKWIAPKAVADAFYAQRPRCLNDHEFIEANTQWRFEKGYWKRACKRCKADKAYEKYRKTNNLGEGDPKSRYRHG